ncbi:MAG: hypothetical protein EB084_23105 [Proteobacteria bacterium]|nr:hypothetical protein [Pseudomonadota bacterium]
MMSLLKSSLRSRCAARLLVFTIVLGALRPAQAIPPWGWHDLIAGFETAEFGAISLVFAAGMSMAESHVFPVSPGSTHPQVHDGQVSVTNPRNRFDDAEAMHNRIIDDYFRSHKTFDVRQFYALLQQSKGRYGVDKLPDISVFEKVINRYRNTSTNEMMQRIDSDLKAAGIKLDIVGQVREIPSDLPLKEIISRIVRIENEALNTRGLNGAQRKTLCIFFSILRHSMACGFSANGR